MGYGGVYSMSDPYIPTRILGGVRPSARDCFGCQDVEIRQYRDRTIRVCGVSGMAFGVTLETLLLIFLLMEAAI
jgi:hypothetical protein